MRRYAEGRYGKDALVILVGNSRAFWPRFCDAYRTNVGGIADVPHPVDGYVSNVVGESAER